MNTADTSNQIVNALRRALVEPMAEFSASSDERALRSQRFADFIKAKEEGAKLQWNPKRGCAETPGDPDAETFEQTIARFEQAYGTEDVDAGSRDSTMTFEQYQGMRLRAFGFPSEAADYPPQNPGGPWLKAASGIATSLHGGPLWVLCGPNGRGKTAMATWAARAGDLSSKEILYKRWPDLVTKIKSTWSRESPITTDQLLSPLKSVWLLVIDDLQGVPDTEGVTAAMVDCVRYRFDNRRATILVSEATQQAVAKTIGAALVERANKRGGFVEFSWSTFRK